MTEIVIKIEDESRVKPFLQMLKLFDFVSDVALKRNNGNEQRQITELFGTVEYDDDYDYKAQRQVRMDALNAVYGEHDSVEEDENMMAMEGLVSVVVEETVW